MNWSFFCASCGAVVEASYGNTTHYALLGFDPAFEVDPAKVDAAYKDLQRKLHPDRHAMSGSDVRELVEAHSARLNEAVAVLRSPLRRAHYWMELHGVRVLEEDQRMEDAETMMEVMETSEELSAANTQAEVNEIAERNAAKVREVELNLASIFAREDWDAARTLVERLQMLTRLAERLNDWRPR